MTRVGSAPTPKLRRARTTAASGTRAAMGAISVDDVYDVYDDILDGAGRSLLR
jgi:hypothetical protein